MNDNAFHVQIDDEIMARGPSHEIQSPTTPTESNQTENKVLFIYSLEYWSTHNNDLFDDWIKSIGIRNHSSKSGNPEILGNPTAMTFPDSRFHHPHSPTKTKAWLGGELRTVGALKPRGKGGRRRLNERTPKAGSQPHENYISVSTCAFAPLCTHTRLTNVPVWMLARCTKLSGRW